MHNFKDDLESFIYVVLYAALRWLPVESSQSLGWWMSCFFGAPRVDRLGGGADHKVGNAISRRYTTKLESTTSPHAVRWLKAATDLHYKNEVPNPLWNDGKELRKMWEEVLAEDLPSNDRVVNEIQDMKTWDDGFLHASYAAVNPRRGIRIDPATSPPPFVGSMRSSPRSVPTPTSSTL